MYNLMRVPSCLVCVSRDMDIWMPDMEQQEVPAGWWDTAADRSLLVGVFKHGEQGVGRQMVLGSG